MYRCGASAQGIAFEEQVQACMLVLLCMLIHLCMLVLLPMLVRTNSRILLCLLILPTGGARCHQK